MLKHGETYGHQPFFAHVSTTDAKITVYNSEVRALLAPNSWRDVYLASEHKVLHIDPLTSQKQPIIDLSGTVEEPHQRWDARNRVTSVKITALAGHESMIAVGGMGGEYAFLDTSCEVGTKPATGLLHCYDRGHFVNHVALGPTRTTAIPHATYASNDGHVRVLDTSTAKVTSDHKYTEPVNNISVSPDLRLQAMACDGHDAPRITNADTGEDVAHPTGASAMDAGRQSHGMTQTSCCAWADDGVTLASGISHSKQVLVHDARKWTEPVTTVGCTRAPAAVTFSHTGDHERRVLAVAERQDFVKLVDAQTWWEGDVIRFKGLVAGVGFVPDSGGQFVVGTATPPRDLSGVMFFHRSEVATTSTLSHHGL
ncbi:MAG: hypothetical protein M1831_000874 [Alyxoria varia]|nr:MAG: hypothetical protein M1831_000874 [Alyxoria varia]